MNQKKIRQNESEMGYAQHSKTEEWEPTKDRRQEGETKEPLLPEEFYRQDKDREQSRHG